MKTRLASIIILIFVLTGCSTITMPVVGKFSDYNEVMVGSIENDLWSTWNFIQIEGKITKTRCTGKSEVTYIPPLQYLIPHCAGQKGEARLKCDNGREVTAYWTAKGCKAGHGTGYDQDGHRFDFVFGMTEEEARRQIDQGLAEVKNKPDLPPAYVPSEVRKEKGFATGTGFFITNDGYLLTNHHVIDGAKELRVITNDKKELVATLIKSDPANDMAIIKVDYQSKPIVISDTSKILKGQEVLTLGYPLIIMQGQEQKASFGRVNSLTGIKDDIRFIQIDIPVQPGNSGGPLLDKKGQVIGIVTATLDEFVALYTSGKIPQNVNYALKIDYAKPLLNLYVKGWKDSSGNRIRDARFEDVVSDVEDSVALIISQ